MDTGFTFKGWTRCEPVNTVKDDAGRLRITVPPFIFALHGEVTAPCIQSDSPQ